VTRNRERMNTLQTGYSKKSAEGGGKSGRRPGSKRYSDFLAGQGEGAESTTNNKEWGPQPKRRTGKITADATNAKVEWKGGGGVGGRAELGGNNLLTVEFTILEI